VRRHRRGSRWFAALSAATTVVTGIPLSAVLSPLVCAAAFIGADVVNFVVPIPDLLDPDRGDPSARLEDPELVPALVVAGIAALLLPGAIVLVCSWFAIRGLLIRLGPAGELARLQARPPRADQLEERQLVNVAAEIAIAGGLSPPPLLLIDSPVANAAVLGSALDDATVVVTTGLLDRLERDETQAIVAHVVASAGNGDLRIASAITSLYVTTGLVSVALAAPVDAGSRRVLGQVLRFTFGRRTPERDARAATLIATLADADPTWETKEPTGCIGRVVTPVVSVLSLPVMMASGAFSMARLIFNMLLVNPLIRRRWRARKHLADASAVELTRNPDALSRALRELVAHAATPPDARWSAHLFAVGAEPTGANAAGASAPLAAFHPPTAERIARLERMGATPDSAPPAVLRPRPARSGCLTAIVVVLFPVIAAVILLLLAVPLVLVGLSFIIDMMFLAPVVLGLHYLLRSLAG
jgi:Zn-dependent protease with chaperone function